MSLLGRTIFVITADPSVMQGCIHELTASNGRYQIRTATSVKQALVDFHSFIPSVIFLDESAVVTANESVESAVALLTEAAPVVVATSAEKEPLLSFLITSGAADFVKREGRFLTTAADLINHRLRVAERAAGMIQFPSDAYAGDFGEILRHEVNNPLTGILGNTELLLARRDRLPPGAVERLETIAGLAVRLRETVRRLSNAWEEEHHETARPA
jgi:signal transduction histidine kinase